MNALIPNFSRDHEERTMKVNVRPSLPASVTLFASLAPATVSLAKENTGAVFLENKPRPQLTRDCLERKRYHWYPRRETRIQKGCQRL
jgi:hypothetical protein